ncbi:MAG: enolase C-terminal domain-like protein [Candidatus Pacearchaeota archaeon]|jgi:enolase
MQIKKIGAKIVFDSRKQKTIQVVVKTDQGSFSSSAPAGKSTGEYEVKSYFKSLEQDIDFIENIDIKSVNDKLEKNRKIIDSDQAFNFLNYIEKLTYNRIGGNSLFVLEASFLKAIAKDNGKELFQLLSENTGGKLKMPRPVGNTIGGGLHSKGRNGKRPDFQEFLFIANGKTFKESFEINNKAYELAGKLLGYWLKTKNDEGAYETDLSNEEVLDIMKNVQELLKKEKQKVDIGLDIASSSFYKDGFYIYKNFHKELDKNSEIKYMVKLIKKYGLLYAEDPLNENDFSAFSELTFETRNSDCMIVGDDLTTTNPERLAKAIRLKSINAIIVKPNQIGSLIKVKEVVEMAKKNNIKTIISHRSGETMDDTISDLAVGFGCDFIKTGIYGKVRKAKLKRLMKIERMIRR